MKKYIAIAAIACGLSLSAIPYANASTICVGPICTHQPVCVGPICY